MKPYYESGGVVVYHSTAEQVLPQLGRFDLLLTDPPYGIGADKGQASRANKRHGKALVASRDYGVTNWDDSPPPRWLLEQAIEKSQWAVIFGGNYFHLPPSRCWLVWDKVTGENDYADCELAWTNLDKAVRMISFQWKGMLTEPGVRKEYRSHPTQKPEPVIRWALLQAPDRSTVLDPFMGSGTTLVAAKRMGLSAVGIEREERYCEVAAERLSQDALPLEMGA